MKYSHCPFTENRCASYLKLLYKGIHSLFILNFLKAVEVVTLAVVINLILRFWIPYVLDLLVYTEIGQKNYQNKLHK